MLSYDSSQGSLLTLLPPELLIRIFGTLGWREILNLRRVCRLFDDISHARPVWVSVFTRYKTTVVPRPFHQYQPVDTYSSKELEKTVLKWQRTELAWDADDASPLRRPAINIKSHIGPVSAVHFIEGGRWILAASKRGGRVYCYDLDRKKLTPFSLIPTPFEKDAEVDVLSISVDMDYSAELFTFNVALFLRRRASKITNITTGPHSEKRLIQVWRVSAEWNSVSQKTKLAARLLSSFPEETIIHPGSLSLLGSHLAYSFDNLRCTVIVEWAAVGGVNIDFPRKYLPGICGQSLALLPNKQILVSHSEKLELWDYNMLPESSLLPSQQDFSRVRTLWSSHHIHLPFNHILRPLVTHDMTRIVLDTMDGLHGLIVPCPGSIDEEVQPPSIVPLFQWLSHPHFMTFSFHKAILVTFPETGTIRFSWPDEKRTMWTTRKESIFKERQGFSFSMDESSGRILVWNNQSSSYFIVEWVGPLVATGEEREESAEAPASNLEGIEQTTYLNV
ncbi:unnamed protein product [Cyclocybe aegerita]|uniref:F-box domain-containing protein n=1 Tax=Cyclocybe aegerita TaxID=1973307 RepID=A0A8S0WC32_CYCAE|nr:unnamed protein product [Cyclocybe aegerita]